jgi:S-DNA-T family DNA segregation ATPase FtsK/SpoIIIE
MTTEPEPLGPGGEPDDTAAPPEHTDDVLEGEVIAFPAAATAMAGRRPAAGQPGEMRRIIPEHLKTWAGIRKAAGWRYRKARHHALYHLVRSPKRLALAVVWAPVGVLRIAAAQMAWWWVSEQAYLRQEAVAANDARTWYQLHQHVREVRLIRGFALAGEVAGIGLAAALVTAHLPLGWLPVLAVLVPVLAWIGRPADKPIVTSAVVPVAYDPLTMDAIVRALGALGIGEMNKALREYPDKAIVPVDPPMRDGPGWLARLDLPYGVTAGAVSEKREELASGLRRPLGCVWPETEHKRHPGALNLYVSDEDMTTAEQPAWPLAKRGTADLFRPQVFGFDPRGRAVTLTLMFASVIIGSVPRMGKTFLLRLLLLICALDLRAELHAYDLKGTGDLAPLRGVAHRYRAGDDPEDIDYLVADWRKLRTELRRRTKVIRTLADEHPDLCPENKVTPELAADKRLGLHPVVIAVDECQVAFEHKTHGTELEEIATDLVKRGPALGMLIILATQRPDAKSIPTGISANAVLRMCLKVMGQTENDMVLGTSQYKRGIRATMFGFEDKGVFYFSGEGKQPVIMRSQNIDGPAAKVIAARARALREAAGRLTGYALGLDEDAEVRSFAADVLAIFGDEDKLSRETIADRLAGAFPGVYPAITPDAVASQLRAAGIEVKRVRERGQARPLTGCERAAVTAAAGHGDA